MNIFYLHNSPKICAQYHNDKHCVKMILETAQLLSTAHRVLDGVNTIGLSKSGRKQKIWQLPDERDANLYKASHINHPSAIWVRQSNSNYRWLFELFCELLDEYTYRYGKHHKSERLLGYLATVPKHIPNNMFTEPTPAMPDECKISGDSIASYRKYYNDKKQHIARWKGRINGRDIPTWYEKKL